MRTTPRPRHEVSAAALKAVTPAFRYSPSRDAYVLRFVGNRVGPVLRRRQTGEQLHTGD
jgi:hypothetical protein